MYLSLEREKVHILEDKRLFRNQIHQLVFQMFSHISLASFGRGCSFISFLSLENPLHFRSAFGIKSLDINGNLG